MPQITDILESLKGAKVFSTLDLKSGYWQMEMEQSSVEKTAFWTASGLYEFLCLPFGLKNSAASFQRLMEHVLREHKNKFCMVYIDDIVVYSPSISTHILHLQKVFACLQKAGLSLNMKKCNFIKTSLTFLGHIISADGVKWIRRRYRLSNHFQYLHQSRRSKDFWVFQAGITGLLRIFQKSCSTSRSKEKRCKMDLV